MRIGFVLPSCNYNIVLSNEDLKQLLDKGYILIRPNKTVGIFKDEYGKVHDTSGHDLIYGDKRGEQSIQYVNIVLDATVENYIKEERII